MEEDIPSEDLLYDILVYHEWPQSQDHRSNSIADTSEQQSKSSKSWSSYLTNWSAAAKLSGLDNYPPSEVLQMLQSLPNWKFSLSPDGSLLAVLQENLLEFYSAKDNFAVSIAKTRVARDPQPSLRIITWSPDSSLLVVTSSGGGVDLYDAYGFLVYSVFSQRLPQNEAANEEFGTGEQSKGYAYAGAFFTDHRVKSRDWLYELILVDYRGSVNSFLLSPSGYQEFSSLKLSSYYKFGLSAVTFSFGHNLLCVAGPLQNQSDQKGPSDFGLTVWRLLSEPPHYDLVKPWDFTETKSKWFYSRSPEQDHIFKLEESPTGEFLAGLHVSGKISVWQMPGLRQAQLWHLEEQPCHDDMNPNLMQNPRLKKRKKQFLNQPFKWNPLDVKWWNDHSLVIGRYSGGVTIVSLKNIDKNMLGDSAEFFAGISHLSPCFGKGFFVLEREITDRRQKPKTDHDDDDDSFGPIESSGEDDDDEDDEEASLIVRGKRMATNIAYLVTESERFAPPRKRQKLTYHNYKLLAFLSTTPEELYSRKITMEEYGEALILAQHYNLDSDQVYERQWKLSNLSVTAINDYLVKIKRRSAVLRECLNTVPNDVEAIKTLLEYGLKETDLHVLDLMEHDENEGRFVKTRLASDNSDYYLTEEEESERKNAEEQRLISRISWDNLSVSQRELLAQRYTLVKYLDRLEAYSEIVERYQRYDREVFFDTGFYVKFRDQAPLEAAIQFAHQGKTRAVATLLERYPNDLEEYKLCILSNFPESLGPDEYADLIPSTDDLLRLNAVAPTLTEDDTQDWIHYDFIKAKIPEHVLIDNEERSRNIPFAKYRAKVLTRELLTRWIHQRAKDIERESSLVDHSLTLLQYASSYCGIQVDLRLHHQLTTLEVLLYDMETHLSLDDMAIMSDLEVLLKLMESKTTKENVVSHLRKYLIPYLDRLEELETGARKDLLQNYLLHSSATSLALPFEVIKSSAAAPSMENQIFMSLDECVNIGLDCIYAYESDEESELIVEMAGFLKKKCRNPHILDEIEDILDIMRAIRLLKRYNIVKTLHYFKACRNDVKAMEDLFVQVTRRAEGKKPGLTAREWSEVLQDLFELRRLIPIVSVHLSLEIFCESLLSSETTDNINLVRDIFDYKPADALFKTQKSAILYALSVHKIGHISLNSKEKIVAKACESYIDSSKDVDDPNLDLARKCLALVADNESPLLGKYHDVLNGLDMLHEFGISILPIVLRNMTNYVPIVQKILQIDPGSAYKSARKILRMLKLVGSLEATNNDEAKQQRPLNEAPILLIIAEYALKANDFDYCLSICDLMMEKPSKEACKVCLRLIHNQDFADSVAKARLTSFCVNYCEDQDIEDMLLLRINLLDDEEPPRAAAAVEVSSPEEASEASGVKNALSKITEKESIIPTVIPESTKVISNLFGKLSKFTSSAAASAAMHYEDMTEQTIDDESKAKVHESPRKKAKSVAINVFYEDLFDQGSRTGLLHSTFENYSANLSNGPIDSATLSLLSRHYRNAFEYDEEDGIEWPVLKDILQIICLEDTALGLSLLNAHDKDWLPLLFNSECKIPQGLGLYLASLSSSLKCLSPQTKALFDFPPGLLYCLCKTFLYQNKLGQDQVFAKALTLLDINDNEDDDK